MRGLLTTSPIWSGVGGFVGRLISLFQMAYMCMIWLNMNLFSWRLVLMVSLSLMVVMTCTLLRFPMSFLLEMDSKTCWTDFVSFLPMPRIQILVLFIDINVWFRGRLFYGWEMYDMLWCAQYCVIIPMGVPLGVKSTLPSKISSLINKLYERSFFNVVRVETFVPSIISEPCDKPFPKLLLC